MTYQAGSRVEVLGGCHPRGGGDPQRHGSPVVTGDDVWAGSPVVAGDDVWAGSPVVAGGDVSGRITGRGRR